MSKPFLHKITETLNHPDYRHLLSIAKGFRNGIFLGVKIRFPHALVMVFLFSNKSSEKIKMIFYMTRTHALNLASFVAIYKTAMLLLSRLNEGNESSPHSLISGFISGYFVFGKQTEINRQIVLYIIARLVMGLGNFPVQRGLIPKVNAFPLVSATAWGLGMWLFRHEPDVYQPSFKATLQYLYDD